MELTFGRLAIPKNVSGLRGAPLGNHPPATKHALGVKAAHRVAGKGRKTPTNLGRWPGSVGGCQSDDFKRPARWRWLCTQGCRRLDRRRSRRQRSFKNVKALEVRSYAAASSACARDPATAAHAWCAKKKLAAAKLQSSRAALFSSGRTALRPGHRDFLASLGEQPTPPPELSGWYRGRRSQF
jgi:hypothetical protein